MKFNFTKKLQKRLLSTVMVVGLAAFGITMTPTQQTLLVDPIAGKVVDHFNDDAESSEVITPVNPEATMTESIPEPERSPDEQGIETETTKPDDESLTDVIKEEATKSFIKYIFE